MLYAVHCRDALSQGCTHALYTQMHAYARMQTSLFKEEEDSLKF